MNHQQSTKVPAHHSATDGVKSLS